MVRFFKADISIISYWQSDGSLGQINSRNALFMLSLYDFAERGV
jgi:hypothetical protein